MSLAIKIFDYLDDYPLWNAIPATTICHSLCLSIFRGRNNKVSALTAVLPSVSGLLTPFSMEGTACVAHDTSALKELVEFFKVLSDETRLKILQYLANEKEQHVRAMCELLKQSQPAVSHHLALLRMVGLIECRRDGKHNFYSIVTSRFREVQETLTGTEPAQALWTKFFPS